MMMKVDKKERIPKPRKGKKTPKKTGRKTNRRTSKTKIRNKRNPTSRKIILNKDPNNKNQLRTKI